MRYQPGRGPGEGTHAGMPGRSMPQPPPGSSVRQMWRSPSGLGPAAASSARNHGCCVEVADDEVEKDPDAAGACLVDEFDEVVVGAIARATLR